MRDSSCLFLAFFFLHYSSWLHFFFVSGLLTSTSTLYYSDTWMRKNKKDHQKVPTKTILSQTTNNGAGVSVMSDDHGASCWGAGAPNPHEIHVHYA